MTEPVSLLSTLEWMKEMPEEPNICPSCGYNMGYRPSIADRQWIPMSRCYKCEEKLKAAEQTRSMADSITAHLINCGVPRQDATKAVEIPPHAIDKVVDAIRGRRSLFIHGGCGVGKTLTTIHILRERILQLYVAPTDCLFRTSTAICEYIRSGIDLGKGTYDARLWEMCIKPVLVIDDLMAEPESKNSKDLIKIIICERYAHRRQTLISSNYNPREALEHYGKRLGSRFSAMAELQLTGADRRAAEDHW